MQKRIKMLSLVLVLVLSFTLVSILFSGSASAKVVYKKNPSGNDIANRAISYYNSKGKGQKDDKKRIKYSQEKRNKAGYGDCSTFVNKVYGDLGITGLGDYTAPQITNKQGKFIKNAKDLKKGDLVFFKDSDGRSGHIVYLPTGKKRVSHVGIYIGNNKFVDLNKSQGTISMRQLNDKNAKGNFLGGKRFAKR